MENSSGFWKWVGAAVLVVVIGLALGFYLSGPPADETATVAANQANAGNASTADPNSVSAVSSTAAPSAVSPKPGPLSNFTAKGAPKITIIEEDPSIKRSIAPPPTVASTSATPPPPTSVPDATAAQEPATTLPGTATAETAPPAAQTETTPVAQPPTVSPAVATPTESGPLYHVLVGTTFASEKNARIFAADLRHRGFMAMTASVTSDSGTVYKVQVGAYRNRLSAEQTASQLQQSGFPAYIATDR